MIYLNFVCVFFSRGDVHPQSARRRPIELPNCIARRVEENSMGFEAKEI